MTVSLQYLDKMGNDETGSQQRRIDKVEIHGNVEGESSLCNPEYDSTLLLSMPEVPPTAGCTGLDDPSAEYRKHNPFSLR